MLPTRNGSIKFFRFRGIDVFVHWSWFLVAMYSVYYRRENYSSPVWVALEYLALFAIVLMHEFGHSLACRQAGGEANQIILWPLGGVAYVNPPQRPGATLWSIAAGPLVNVVLFPILTYLNFRCRYWHLPVSLRDLPNFVDMIWMINKTLLIFNLLPVYPLDGGQILRSLLWFWLGRRKSLAIAAVIGMFGVAGFLCIAVFLRSPWLGVISIFALTNCWRGWKESRLLKQMEAIPRHEQYTCPSCQTHPMRAQLWACGACQVRFDTFETKGICPNCLMVFDTTRCPECGVLNPIRSWGVVRSTTPPPPPVGPG